MGDISEALGENFVPENQEAPKNNFDPLPAGWYPVEVENSELKATDSGLGKYINIQFSVIGEHYANRKLFAKINIVNPSTKCVEFGRRELGALGRAVGLLAIGDSAELIGCKLEVRVKIKKDEGYEASNEIKEYRALGSGEDNPSPQSSAESAASNQPPSTTRRPVTAVKAATQPPATSAGKKRPWEK